MNMPRLRKAVGVVALAALLGASCSKSEAEGPRADEDGTFKVHTHDGFPHYIGHFRAETVESIPHDPASAMRGLAWNGDVLFESGGGEGSSFIGSSTGARFELDGKFSATGLTTYDNHLYQLTGDANEVLVYNATSLTQTKTLQYSGEGWGLCNKDDDYFVLSNGTGQLTTRSLNDFSFIKSIEVTLKNEELSGLNGLECVGDQVWANISDPNSPNSGNTIVAIDINNGKVEATVDTSEIQLTNTVGASARPLTGITVRDDATMWISGDGWPAIHQIRLIPVDVSA